MATECEPMMRTRGAWEGAEPEPMVLLRSGCQGRMQATPKKDSPGTVCQPAFSLSDIRILNMCGSLDWDASNGGLEFRSLRRP